MKKGFTLIELLAIVSIIGIALIILIPLISHNESTLKYEYIDSDGNKGYAKYCTTDSILYCELEDGTIRGVIQYKAVKE